MGSLVICLTPYDFSGPLIDYFQRWQKLVQDPTVYLFYDLIFVSISKETLYSQIQPAIGSQNECIMSTY